MPLDGPSRVLLGSYGSAWSAIESPSPINYLAIRLKAGERWRYEPPRGHTVLWVALASGVLSAPDELRHGELAAFEPSSKAVEFEALTDAEFVLGSAAPHQHDLLLGAHVARGASRCRGAHLVDQEADTGGDGVNTFRHRRMLMLSWRFKIRL